MRHRTRVARLNIARTCGADPGPVPAWLTTPRICPCCPCVRTHFAILCSSLTRPAHRGAWTSVPLPTVAGAMGHALLTATTIGAEVRELVGRVWKWERTRTRRFEMVASRSEALAWRRVTYLNLLDAPAHPVAEIVDGALYTHLQPAPPHTRASSLLGGKIDTPLDFDAGDPGGWWSLDESKLHLGDDVLVRDLTGWCRERMAEPPDTPYFPSPRIGCARCCRPRRESSTSRASGPFYAREDNRHLWLVDPTDRALETFELRNGEYVPITVANDDEPVSIRPFDAITFSLGDLWP